MDFLRLRHLQPDATPPPQDNDVFVVRLGFWFTVAQAVMTLTAFIVLTWIFSSTPATLTTGSFVSDSSSYPLDIITLTDSRVGWNTWDVYKNGSFYFYTDITQSLLFAPNLASCVNFKWDLICNRSLSNANYAGWNVRYDDSTNTLKWTLFIADKARVKYFAVAELDDPLNIPASCTLLAAQGPGTYVCTTVLASNCTNAFFAIHTAASPYNWCLTSYTSSLFANTTPATWLSVAANIVANTALVWTCGYIVLGLLFRLLTLQVSKVPAQGSNNGTTKSGSGGGDVREEDDDGTAAAAAAGKANNRYYNRYILSKKGELEEEAEDHGIAPPPSSKYGEDDEQKDEVEASSAWKDSNKQPRKPDSATTLCRQLGVPIVVNARMVPAIKLTRTHTLSPEDELAILRRENTALRSLATSDQLSQIHRQIRAELPPLQEPDCVIGVADVVVDMRDPAASSGGGGGGGGGGVSSRSSGSVGGGERPTGSPTTPIFPTDHEVLLDFSDRV